MARTFQIPITFECEPIALPYNEAAKSLGVSRYTLRRRVNEGKLREGPNKTFAVEELRRFAREEGPTQ